jgi:hypothetical protein
MWILPFPVDKAFFRGRMRFPLESEPLTADVVVQGAGFAVR